MDSPDLPNLPTLGTRHWPLIASLAFFWLTMLVMLVLSLNLTSGRLIYPLDDTYIEMAMAKNSVLHGVWGVTRYEFSGSSSSPFWTLLITVAYYLFGVNEVAPFVLSVLSGTVAVMVVYSVLKKHISSRPVIFAACVLGILLAPLPPVAFTGMEHALHAALTLGLVWLAARVLSSPGRLRLRDALLLAALTTFLTAIRYEGLFLALVLCVLLLLNRRVIATAVVGASALFVPVAYGIWSVSAGWYFLPNSVLLKGSLPGLSAKGIIQTLFGYNAWANAGKSPHLLLLLIVASFLLVVRAWRKSTRSTTSYALVIFIGTALLHLNFALAGWFYRYDAYLVMTGLTAIAVAAWELRLALRINTLASPRRAAATLFLVLVFSPIAIRAARSLYNTPQATRNIYEQQYQMGLFLDKYYRGTVVAANDIGAISFLADTRLLDLIGLASRQLARLELHNHYSEEQAIGFVKQEGVRIAVVYRDWFSSPDWVEVGQWRIKDNVACARDNVSIYAVDSSATAELVRNLRAFASDLPADVEQSGLYTQP
jgi:hypothetical protein